MELTDNPEIMSALDDLITLLITVGLYATAYVDVRPDSTNVEAHQHALQYVANHPISQKLATQATTAALDRITEVNE